METRRVSLLVGRKSYNLLTTLDDKKLKRVYDLLHEIVAETDPAMDQDERLFIVCMKLASALVDTAERMENILSKGDDTAAES